MSVQAVVFDLDGTLLNTLDDLADAMTSVLRHYGCPEHPVDSYRFFVGNGLANLTRQAMPPGTPDDVIVTATAMLKKAYAANWSVKTRPYEGVPEMIDDFRRRAIPMTILSNKADEFTQAIVKHYFPEGTFAAVRGQTDDVPKKPDPAGALLITESLGVRPEDCLYFGDTDTDMATGLAANMFTIGVTWGFRPLAELVGAGAMAIIDHPSEAIRFVDDESARKPL
ncbi:MAG: HAD family hydrolase [Planctomycetes bacterium]|nr:HAD family hydrolase [Planctomycetota bacterium]MCD7897726.1 HAD family hydrolase [Planctomycetaceae bacterium]